MLRALIVDDAPDDAELMARSLQRAGSRVHFDRVETEEAMADALQRGGWDVVLCDYAMPSFSAERALALLARTQPSLPAIIVSGAIGEEAAAAVIRAGAIDFVSKDHLTLLPAAVRRALDEAAGRPSSRASRASCATPSSACTLCFRAPEATCSTGGRVSISFTAHGFSIRVPSVRIRQTVMGPARRRSRSAEPSPRAKAPLGSMRAVEPGGEADADPRELRLELEQARLELEQARETLRAIRAGGFDALVIDTGSGDELFTLSDAERPYEVMAEGALRYFRAVALDYDGTLAEGEVAPDTLAALAEARARGIRVILVTGRIISELSGVFAGFEHHFDAVVAENGAVLLTRSASAGWPPRSIEP